MLFLPKSVAKETPNTREIKHIYDFSRGGLNARLHAHIQTLLRGHKYALFIFQRADFGGLEGIQTVGFCLIGRKIGYEGGTS